MPSKLAMYNHVVVALDPAAIRQQALHEQTARKLVTGTSLRGTLIIVLFL